ncbi:hypothetical protein [Streptomyces marispadix]|uniref:Integral membrane protein n=1 Tax=Streptomyces marispadix TaxID=2922868 RepID=A0ABS9SXD7_9ACTN|nr:hypothetical protein [Streptomyces marispadix]MCH6160916.1 hypothetical protein [Streptomyces marispadix]
MVRNLLGILLALAGAALAVWSPFSSWYGGRLGRDYETSELFGSGGITGTQAGLWTGLFVPMLAAAALAFLAALLRSRLLMTLAGLLVLGFTILWMVRQGQEAGTLTAGGGGLGEGAGYAIGGGVLLLLAALVMRGRRRRGRRRKGRGGTPIDEGRAAPPQDEAYEGRGWEHSEMPQPYGPFGTDPGTGPGGHGAYQADGLPGGPGGPRGSGGPPYGQPPGRPHGYGRDLYHDDSTPPQEWDPWAAGRPAPPPDIPPALNEPPVAPPGPAPGVFGAPPGGSADEAPQGPQQQPPAEPADQEHRPGDDTRHLPRRPGNRGGGPR